MRVRATDILIPPSGPLLTGEGFEFQGTLEDAQNLFAGSADIKNAFHLMGIFGWLQAFFSRCQLSSHPKLCTQEKRSIEDVLLPLPMGFSWAKFFFSGFYGPLHARGKC